MVDLCPNCGKNLFLSKNGFCSILCKQSFSAKKRLKQSCPKCLREISCNNFKRHVAACKGKKKGFIYDTEVFKFISDNKFKCLLCNRFFKKLGLKEHFWRAHTEEGKKFDPNKGYADGRRAWNLGLTKDTDLRVNEGSKTILLKYANGYKNPFDGKHHSKETRESLSKSLSSRRRFRKFYFKYEQKNGSIVNLESTFELKVAQSLDENNIRWDRPAPLLWRDTEGVLHRYFPDFYLNDFDVYLDPKNDYLIPKALKKISAIQEQDNVRIFILDKDHLSWDYIQSLLQHPMAPIDQLDKSQVS